MENPSCHLWHLPAFLVIYQQDFQGVFISFHVQSNHCRPLGLRWVMLGVLILLGGRRPKKFIELVGGSWVECWCATKRPIPFKNLYTESYLIKSHTESVTESYRAFQGRTGHFRAVRRPSGVPFSAHRSEIRGLVKPGSI